MSTPAPTAAAAPAATSPTSAPVTTELPDSLPPRAPRRIVLLLAFACALTVANLYYCQTLLPEIAKTDRKSVV